jgi:hypothetical protein
VLDSNHIIDWTLIQVENEGDFRVEPIHILDHKVKVLRNKAIGLLKVQCTYYNIEYAHRSMKKQCGRNTHNFLSILKKMEFKNARLHFWVARFQNHISEFLVTYVDIPNKRIMHLDGLKAMKGEHCLGQ